MIWRPVQSYVMAGARVICAAAATEHDRIVAAADSLSRTPLLSRVVPEETKPVDDGRLDADGAWLGDRLIPSVQSAYDPPSSPPISPPPPPHLQVPVAFEQQETEPPPWQEMPQLVAVPGPEQPAAPQQPAKSLHVKSAATLTSSALWHRNVSRSVSATIAKLSFFT